VCGSTDPILYRSASIKDGAGRASVTAKDVPLFVYNQEPLGLTLSDPSGTIYASSVPGVAMILKGSTYKFVAPKGATGIIRASVKESRTPGFFTVKMKVKQGWPPGTALFDETQTIVGINVGGQCFLGNATKVRL
jgi:hypothetical protein